ncbi:MAG: DUF962 domain-containing protein [Byssovorax sp.]
MSDAPFQSFEDFWPFYVREHANKTNRTLHFIGTSLAMGCVAAAALTKRKAFLLAAPVMGYGFAWFGHFVVEGNRPATFKYPAWSLRGDFRMWRLIAAGEMDDEVARVLRDEAAGEKASQGKSNGEAKPGPKPAASTRDPQTLN